MVSRQSLLPDVFIEIHSLFMVQEIVRAVVADVSEYTTTVSNSAAIPIVIDNAVSNLPEGWRKNREHGRR